MNVTLRNTGSLEFPRYCPRCLTPNPERTFSLKFERPMIVPVGWDTRKALQKWTLNVPICDSCYTSKLKRTLMLYVPMVVGVLIFLASFAISISLAQEQTAIFGILGGSLVAAMLSFYSLFLVLKKMPKAPVEIRSASSASIDLWFENDPYAKMLSDANKGILLS